MGIKRALLGLFLWAGLPAGAATVQVSDFSAAAYDAAFGGFGAGIVENFESYGEGNVESGWTSAVGRFSSVGGTGSGGTVKNAGFDNNGALLAVRDGNVYGRSSTTRMLTGDGAHDGFLDSNDTYGIVWNASLGGRAFSQILLTVADAADSGAAFHIWAGGSTTVLEKLRNGSKQLVLINFAEAVTEAEIRFENYKGNGRRTNDGFSIDDVAIAPVPIPASILFLGAGLLGLGVLRRVQNGRNPLERTGRAHNSVTGAKADLKA